MTDRTANAVIRNETGVDIGSVSLIHKYSDNYVDAKQWDGILPTGSTTDPALVVRYHTGFLTTGMDWWRVTWVNADKQLCMTDPNNFQGIFNMVEGLLKDNASWAELKLLQEAPESGEGAPFLVAGAGVIKALDAFVLNNESTVGFKENMLRSDDAGQTVTVTLKADKTVTISSPSGSSDTVWTVMDPASGQGG
jgi:hypothetical protein